MDTKKLSKQTGEQNKNNTNDNDAAKRFIHSLHWWIKNRTLADKKVYILAGSVIRDLLVIRDSSIREEIFTDYCSHKEANFEEEMVLHFEKIKKFLNISMNSYPYIYYLYSNIYLTRANGLLCKINEHDTDMYDKQLKELRQMLEPDSVEDPVKFLELLEQTLKDIYIREMEKKDVKTKKSTEDEGTTVRETEIQILKVLKQWVLSEKYDMYGVRQMIGYLDVESIEKDEANQDMYDCYINHNKKVDEKNEKIKEVHRKVENLFFKCRNRYPHIYEFYLEKKKQTMSKPRHNEAYLEQGNILKTMLSSDRKFKVVNLDIIEKRFASIHKEITHGVYDDVRKAVTKDNFIAVSKIPEFAELIGLKPQEIEIIVNKKKQRKEMIIKIRDKNKSGDCGLLDLYKKSGKPNKIYFFFDLLARLASDEQEIKNDAEREFRYNYKDKRKVTIDCSLLNTIFKNKFPIGDIQAVINDGDYPRPLFKVMYRW